MKILTEYISYIKAVVALLLFILPCMGFISKLTVLSMPSIGDITRIEYLQRLSSSLSKQGYRKFIETEGLSFLVFLIIPLLALYNPQYPLGIVLIILVLSISVFNKKVLSLLYTNDKIIFLIYVFGSSIILICMALLGILNHI